MGIVNGTNGIATAFSTSTPSHNPLDVIKWYKDRCEGKTSNQILPWYNNFKGKMKIINRDSSDLNEEMLPADLDQDRPVSSPKRERTFEEAEIEKMDKDNLSILEHAKESRLTLKTFGKYDITGFHKNDGPIIKITELPVRTWIGRYRKWLEFLVHQKGKERPIYDFKDNSTTEVPHFEIHWNSNYKTPNHLNLRLTRSFGLSNITLIDHRGFPSKYASVEEVMEKYFKHMLTHYNEVKNNRIRIEEERVIDITYRMKFIINVLNKNIPIIKVKEDLVRDKMKEFEIPFEYYDKSRSRDFSEESLEKYKIQMSEAKAREKLARETTAEKIWLLKLEILEKELRKRYKNKHFNMKK